MKDIIIFGANDFGRILKYYLEEDNDPRKICAFTMNKEYIKDDTFCGLPIIPFEEINSTYSPDEYEILID